MKKVFLFLSFLACVFFTNAQNLLTNSSFETWTSGKPDSWTVGTTGTLTQSTTALNNTLSSMQIAATGTYSVTQVVVAPNVTFDTNKKYKIVVNYKTTAGDGTDERVWCNWITSAVGATTTTYWSMTLADSLGLKGPGGNVQPASGTLGNGTNGYLVSNKASGEWTQYTYSFYPPAGATQFSFQIRTYNGATVIWDELYFGEDIITDTNTDVNEVKSNIRVFVSDRNLVILDSPSNMIELYSTNGSKIRNLTLVNNSVKLNDLSKGVYFIKINNFKTKILLK